MNNIETVFFGIFEANMFRKQLWFQCIHFELNTLPLKLRLLSFQIVWNKAVAVEVWWFIPTSIVLKFQPSKMKVLLFFDKKSCECIILLWFKKWHLCMLMWTVSIPFPNSFSFVSITKTKNNEAYRLYQG